MWITNRIGVEQTWYSEEDVQKFKDKINLVKSACTNTYTRSKEANDLKRLILSIYEKE